MEKEVIRKVTLQLNNNNYKVVILGKNLPVGVSTNLYKCTFEDGQTAVMVVRKNPVTRMYEGEPLTEHPHSFLDRLLCDAILKDFV